MWLEGKYFGKVNEKRGSRFYSSTIIVGVFSVVMKRVS